MLWWQVLLSAAVVVGMTSVNLVGLFYSCRHTGLASQSVSGARWVYTVLPTNPFTPLPVAGQMTAKKWTEQPCTAGARDVSWAARFVCLLHDVAGVGGVL